LYLNFKNREVGPRGKLVNEDGFACLEITEDSMIFFFSILKIKKLENPGASLLGWVKT